MEKLITWVREKRGRLSELARALDITPAAITQWKQVPAERMRAISDFTGIPMMELRPDIFDDMDGAA